MESDYNISEVFYELGIYEVSFFSFKRKYCVGFVILIDSSELLYISLEKGTEFYSVLFCKSFCKCSYSCNSW